MAERGELDLTGAKQNTGVWLVKVRREPHGALPKVLGLSFPGHRCSEKRVAVAPVCRLENLL